MFIVSLTSIFENIGKSYRTNEYIQAHPPLFLEFLNRSILKYCELKIAYCSDASYVYQFFLKDG